MSPPTRESAPTGSAPHGPSRQASSENNTTTGKEMHLRLARMAGVDIDLILGDLAQMGWAVTDDDIDIINALSLARTGVVR